jgi:hypothetical protein
MAVIRQDRPHLALEVVERRARVLSTKDVWHAQNEPSERAMQQATGELGHGGRNGAAAGGKSKNSLLSFVIQPAHQCAVNRPEFDLRDGAAARWSLE